MLTGLIQRAFGLTPKDATDRNIVNLYIEIGFASVLGAIVTFNSAFAIRLGASNELVALLTSIPAMVAAIFSIPSARFLERLTNRKPWIFGSLIVLRLGYLVVALLPVLFPNWLTAAQWLVVWLIALNLPAIFFINGFQAMLGDMLPEKRRAFVLSRRSIIWSVGLAIVSAVVGIVLESQKAFFPLNYQVIYTFGVITALGSSYYLNKLVVPEAAHRPTRHNLRVQDVQRLPDAAPVTPVKMTPPIRRMLFNTAIYHIGLTLAVPLFNVYYITRLNATDDWLGINSAAANIGVIIGYVLWERLLRKRTFAWGLRTATAFTFLFPVGIALFPNLNMIIFFNFLVNVMHPGVELSSFNLLLKLSDPAHRAIVMSWFNTVINLMLCVAPLVGAWLAGFSAIDIPGVLIIAGIFRIIGSILFRVNSVGQAADTTP
jgi:MFS family permease